MQTLQSQSLCASERVSASATNAKGPVVRQARLNVSANNAKGYHVVLNLMRKTKQ